MTGAEPTTIGQRIRQLRGSALTQVELAAAAGVSVDLIRKLEQGRRHTASIGSLHRIARALDVDTAELLAKTTPLPAAESEGGVVAIREVLASVDDLVPDPVRPEPLSLDEAERTVTYLWGAYWSGRFDLLGSLLPGAIAQLRATVRQATTACQPRAAAALARGLQAAGDTLVHLGQTDAAFLAIRHALDAAQLASDPLLDAALRMSLAWQMLVQGRLGDSERVALYAAEQIEPHGTVPPDHLAAYGLLTVTAATVVARAGDLGRTGELLSVSYEYADRLGTDRSAHQTTFGPAKVMMLAVDCHVVLDEFGEALAAAKQLSREAPLPLATRARHLADVAYAQTRLGRDDQALSTLLAMEDMTPDWIKYQTLPRQVVRELLERERRVRTPRLRELARRPGVASA